MLPMLTREWEKDLYDDNDGVDYIKIQQHNSSVRFVWKAAGWLAVRFGSAQRHRNEFNKGDESRWSASLSAASRLSVSVGWAELSRPPLAVLKTTAGRRRRMSAQ